MESRIIIVWSVELSLGKTRNALAAKPFGKRLSYQTLRVK